MGRAAGLVPAALVLAGFAAAAHAQCTQGDGDWVRLACYSTPRFTGLYGHHILGDTPEWSALTVALGPRGRAAAWSSGRSSLTLRQPEDELFEDVAPHVTQLDGDGPPEIIVVSTAYDKGASLTVLNLGTQKMASTPYIGQPHRWLAPIGAADLDGDGRVELAYIDRPHLARVLQVWGYGGDGMLSHIADLPGYTNHRIGDTAITGGIRDCGTGPEMVVVDADWQSLVAVRWRDAAFSAVTLAPYSAAAATAAMACR